jgi:hypothetical protein
MASDVRVSTKLAFVQRVPNLNNYNAGGNTQRANVVDPHLLFFHDDLDFPSEHNYFNPNLIEQYICHGPICVVVNPSKHDV